MSSPSKHKPPQGVKVIPTKKTGGMKDLIEQLQSASNSDEMEISCQNFSRVFGMEVKAAKKKLLDKIASLKSDKELLLKEYSQKLEDEKRLKHQLDHARTEYKLIDKQRVKSLQAQLQAAINERDSLISKIDELEDRCEDLQLINTLQKSLGSERNNEQQLLETNHELEAERRKVKVIMTENARLRDELEKTRVQRFEDSVIDGKETDITDTESCV